MFLKTWNVFYWEMYRSNCLILMAVIKSKLHLTKTFDKSLMSRYAVNKTATFRKQCVDKCPLYFLALQNLPPIKHILIIYDWSSNVTTADISHLSSFFKLRRKTISRKMSFFNFCRGSPRSRITALLICDHAQVAEKRPELFFVVKASDGGLIYGTRSKMSANKQPWKTQIPLLPCAS